VEARRRAGYDSHLAGDAVVIHEIDTTRTPQARLVNHSGDGDTRVSAGMWTPGMVFVDAANDIAVSVDAATGTGFQVTLYTGPLPWPKTPAGDSLVIGGAVTFTWQPAPGARRYEVKVDPEPASRGAPPIMKVADSAELTIDLADGSYAWSVRALPDGQWTPSSHVQVGRAAGRWLPGEVIVAAGPDLLSRPAVTALHGQEVYVAWAQAPDVRSPASIYAARRAGDGWQIAGPIGREQDMSPEFDLRLAWSRDGEVCAAWKKCCLEMPGVGVNPRGVGRSPALWNACWPTGLQRLSAGSAADAQGTGSSAAVAVRIDQEANTTPPVTPEILTDEVGNAYAVWVEFGPDGKADVRSAFRPEGGNWAADPKISDRGRAPRWDPALAVDDRGNTHAIWADGRNEGIDIYAAYRPAGGAWQANVRLTGDGAGNHRRPVVAVDGSGNAYAAWQEFRKCGEDQAVGSIRFAVRPAAGAWQPSVIVREDIGGERVSRPAIAATPEGGVVLVWEEESAGAYALYSAYRSADGAWEPRTAIEGSEGNSAASDPVLMVDTQGNATLAWIEHRGARSGLRVAVTAPQ